MTTEQPAPVSSAAFPNGSLYVGDLRDDVGESDIYDAFKECGPILSVRVCRDVKDQRSLGYAYVNFQSPENAQKALDTLNGKRLKGKPCRVMWSHRDPSRRKSGEGNLFVKSLDPSVDLVQLQDVFSRFGATESCKVVYNDQGVSLCYGFVQFEKPEDATKALQAAKDDKDQFKNLGANIVVEAFVPRHLRANSANETYTNLYVKNIGAKFFKEDLEKMFSVFGEITSPIIMMDTKTNESRRFGFVNFKDHPNAVAAQKALDKKVLKWKDGVLVGPVEESENVEDLKKEGFEVMSLYVARAEKKRERERAKMFEPDSHLKPAPKTNLYIRNLADSVSEDDLRNLFKEYGVIKSVRIMMTANGVSRGFGFCDFSTTESANDAIQKVQGHLFHGKPLYVAHAMKKQDRRAMLELQQNNARMMPAMGGMYRQQMFPNMYMFQMPNMYPYMRQMYPRQAPYQRNYHRTNQVRRPKPQAQMQQTQQQVMASPMPQMQQPQQPVVAPQQAEIVIDKQQIGEHIYTRIMKMFTDEALWGKLTGMLLESIPLNDLAGLIHNEAALIEKINQAKEYYDQHQSENPQK